MKQVGIALVAVLCVACQPGGEPTAEENVTQLMRACAETDRLLGQMKAAEASFRYDEAGNARISESLWNTIPSSIQEALINAIAYRAICSTGEPGEQVVTVRSSETSEILAQQTVTEFDR